MLACRQPSIADLCWVVPYTSARYWQAEHGAWYCFFPTDFGRSMSERLRGRKKATTHNRDRQSVSELSEVTLSYVIAVVLFLPQDDRRTVEERDMI